MEKNKKNFAETNKFDSKQFYSQVFLCEDLKTPLNKYIFFKYTEGWEDSSFEPMLAWHAQIPK